MLADAEVIHLSPVFEASRWLNAWINNHCPGNLYVGTFWVLCLTPVFLAVAAVALWPGQARWRAALYPCLILGALLLARFPYLCYDRINPDEAFLLASSMRVPIDAVPFRSFDAFTSGPLNIYTLSIPTWFGAMPTYVTERLTGITLVFGTLTFLWLACRRLLGERAASIALLPWFCFYFFAGDADFTHFSSEHVAIFLGTAALSLLAYEYGDGQAMSLRRLALGGMAAGAMMFGKLQAAPVEAVILAIGAGIAWRKPRRLAALTSLTGGAALVPCAFVAMFLMTGAFSHFWISYFRKNAVYTGVAALTPAGRIRLAWQLLFESNLGTYEIGLAAVGVLGLGAAVALAMRVRQLPTAEKAAARRALRSPAEIALASCLLLAAAFAAVATPGREFMHYLLFLVVPSGLVTASSILWMRTWFESRGPRAAPGLERAALACFVLLICLLPTALRDHLEDAWDMDYFAPGAPLPAAVRRYASKRDTVAVWGWRSDLYVASGRAPATRFADSVLQIEAGSYQPYYRDLYLSDFERARPVLFIDGVGPGDFTYTDRGEAGYEVFEGLREAVARDYHQVGDIDGARLFVRNR